MTSGADQTTPNTQLKVVTLVSLASLSALGYAVLLKLSQQFADGVVAEEKPTLLMLAIFGALFIVHWVALWIAVRLPDTRSLVLGLFAAACLFRGILLPSIPMHEIDIYRYIWDGAVLADGISPYRYSPEQVRDAVAAGGVDDDTTLQRLVELQATSGSLSESLETIHFGQYPSPYPMVSQAVFAVAAMVTPDEASSHTRLTIMKTLLVLFDVATLVVVVLLLRQCGMHAGWSIAYGWCPLMMKEVANGGHLDSIAVFLTTLAVLLLVMSARAIARPKLYVALCGGMLAFAIGAKLYPVVLLPLFAAVWLRQQGWKAACVGIATTVAVSAMLLYPLLGPSEPNIVDEDASGEQPTMELGQLNEPTAPVLPAIEADDGIEAFLTQWEMNDLVFMLVLENLRPQGEVVPEQRPWFVFTDDEWSRSVVTRWAVTKNRVLGRSDELADEKLTTSQLKRESYSLARLIVGGAFGIYACLLAWIAAGSEDPKVWARAAMLTLAWFWLTCPTQNPWYWCWVLPFLPFARYRAWHAVAALTMLYYLRFWLMAHYQDPGLLETPYDGAYFFYFVIAWVEFLPVLIALAIEWGFSQISAKRKTA